MPTVIGHYFFFSSRKLKAIQQFPINEYKHFLQIIDFAIIHIYYNFNYLQVLLKGYKTMSIWCSFHDMHNNVGNKDRNCIHYNSMIWIPVDS